MKQDRRSRERRMSKRLQSEQGNKRRSLGKKCREGSMTFFTPMPPRVSRLLPVFCAISTTAAIDGPPISVLPRS